MMTLPEPLEIRSWAGSGRECSRPVAGHQFRQRQLDLHIHEIYRGNGCDVHRGSILRSHRMDLFWRFLAPALNRRWR